MNYEILFILALFQTLIVEIGVLFLFFKYVFKKKIHIKKLILVGIVASSLTIPYLWFVLPSLLIPFYVVLIGEVLIWLIEAYLYKEFLEITIKQALYVSLIANLASILVGLI